MKLARVVAGMERTIGLLSRLGLHLIRIMAAIGIMAGVLSLLVRCTSLDRTDYDDAIARLAGLADSFHDAASPGR